MAADAVISERENAFICDGCLKDILDPRVCAICGEMTSQGNDNNRKTRAD